MPVFSFRKGQKVQIGTTEFLILRRLPERKWQLENTASGEWCTFVEDELLDHFAGGELSFIATPPDSQITTDKLSQKLRRDLSAYPPKLIELAQVRVQYLKEIDRRQPIPIVQRTIEHLISSVAKQHDDATPPGWRTICRDYRKWIATGRDIRAIIPRHADRGNRVPRVLPEVKAIVDQVIAELYMTPERKRVPEVYLEILRRLSDANRFRSMDDRLPLPSKRMIYREIERKSSYEVTAARFGKRRAEMDFRVSIAGPSTSHALQRVAMDHTPADLIVVDDNTMLPLGRPTITTALDECTRCPIGFYSGFEPPSCLAIMRCLRHAILPKTYVGREFPSIKNSWECYGVPELVVVDNPPEFHSSHFERACLQIGTDIQYAKVLVPWYKGKLERFQGTMNRDLMHGEPGTTFSNILERDDYDPSKQAVVMLSTFREILHKWIIDVYMQTPHRGIHNIPADKWRSDTSGLPPPLPPSATTLDIVLGMTVQRSVFHYGIELEGLKYNSGELGELRRVRGTGIRVDLTFDPGDLGYINVLDPFKGNYIRVPALDQAYASRLSLWQHKVIRHYTTRRLDGRTDMLALAQAKSEIRSLVDRDFHRKSTHGRKRHARFLSEPALLVPTAEVAQNPWSELDIRRQQPVSNSITLDSASSTLFSDDEMLPVFEANLDLPHPPIVSAISPRGTITLEEA
jgi:putative transposase